MADGQSPPADPQPPRRRPKGHGGWRPGAGRKPKGEKAGVSHRSRPALAARFPVHVLLERRPGLPSLQQAAEREVLLAAFAAGCSRRATEGDAETFRLCHFAIRDAELHFVVEARDRVGLSRGMQGLLIRCAKRLNILWHRRGRVFADRYRARILRTAGEVDDVLRSLFGLPPGVPRSTRVDVARAVAALTSVAWCEGAGDEPRRHVRGGEAMPRPVAGPRTWLLSAGCRRVAGQTDASSSSTSVR